MNGLNRQVLLRRLLAIVLIAGATTLAGGHADAGSTAKRYRILVTNDDGLSAKGILALTRQLRTIAEVITVVPMTDQSASSHSTKLLKGETWVVPHYQDNKLIGYEVDGTPADAVRFGIMIVGKRTRFDLVVSGINEGVNVGQINLYSGTIGAAMESLLHGVPALAVSQSRRRSDNFELSARLATKIIVQMLENGSPKDALLSVNVPAGDVRGVLIRPVGGLVMKVEDFSRDLSDKKRMRYTWRLGFVGKQPRGSDSEAFLQNFATVTPIGLDRTAYKAIPKLESWNLSLPDLTEAQREDTKAVPLNQK